MNHIKPQPRRRIPIPANKIPKSARFSMFSPPRKKLDPIYSPIVALSMDWNHVSIIYVKNTWSGYIGNSNLTDGTI
jgi:hypothetical protein